MDLIGTSSWSAAGRLAGRRMQQVRLSVKGAIIHCLCAGFLMIFPQET
jgi:hypothetical protein